MDKPKPTPKQVTPKGMQIPIPKRSEVMAGLKRAAMGKPPKKG
jgi:hypothetical protein